MHTDGSIAVVALQKCRPVDPQPDIPTKGYKPGNHVFRFVRRQILTFRNDMLRANIIYGAYYAGRMTWTALRRKNFWKHLDCLTPPLPSPSPLARG